MSLQALLDMVPNKLSDNKVITPYHIAEEMVNSVLNNIDLDLETTFLDPVCKSGIFLKILYDKLMAHPVLVNSFEKPEDRSNHILDKMIYGIALDETCQLITQRLLYGRVTDGGNIIYIRNYIKSVIDKQYEKVQQAIEKELNRDMKRFGVIIGNPPYQEATGGGHALSQYTETFLKVV